MSFQEDFDRQIAAAEKRVIEELERGERFGYTPTPMTLASAAVAGFTRSGLEIISERNKNISLDKKSVM